MYTFGFGVPAHRQNLTPSSSWQRGIALNGDVLTPGRPAIAAPVRALSEPRLLGEHELHGRIMACSLTGGNATGPHCAIFYFRANGSALLPSGLARGHKPARTNGICEVRRAATPKLKTIMAPEGALSTVQSHYASQRFLRR